MLTNKLLSITLMGAEWVLYLLLALSVFSVAVMVERLIAIRRARSSPEETFDKVRELVEKGEFETARGKVNGANGTDAQVLAAGLAVAGKGAAAVEEAVGAETARLRLMQDKYLAYLGTLGNNAPFIGLLGTVLGIIKAFNDLSLNATGGASAVMAGISEALVATAVGLFVAIPAVVAYNYFLREVKKNVTGAEIAGRYLVSILKGEKAER
ncbi:MAG: MotA/TolQ/ExbB proton channel family protein [Deltaproteobacteria bacterium]|nr:MotA/TolQ/ExbB proton channel family protein [Deltaproteobacteria bacterium]